MLQASPLALILFAYRNAIRVPPHRAAVLVETFSDGTDTLAAGFRGSDSVHFLRRGRRSRRSARLCNDLKVILLAGRSGAADAQPCLVPHHF